MIVLLGWALAAQAVPACRATGSGVSCLLAPPRRIETALVVPMPTPKRIVPKRRPAKHVAHVTHSAKRKPPTEEQVRAHIASLVSIGDCTGARAYVVGVGKADIADRTFGTCVGGPHPPVPFQTVTVDAR